MNFAMIMTLEEGHLQVYQSEIQNNSEFDYRIYVSILDFSQATGDEGFAVNVEIAKTVKYITKKQKDSIKQTYCVDKITDYDVCDYGFRAILDGCKDILKTKNEAIEVAESFMNKADQYSMLLGFYLDKYQNKIGNTGWNFLNGKIG